MTELPIETSGTTSFFGRFRLDCSAVSIPSPARQANEDRYVFAAPGLPAAERAKVGYLFVVADGSSAGGRGALAAQATVDVARTILQEERAGLLRPDLLEMKLFEANDTVSAKIGGHSTATGLWLWESGEDDSRLEAGWANVGDSRLYHKKDGTWSAITVDHARGRFLMRAIGDGNGLVVDKGRLRPQVDEWFLLVTDGVWKRACPVVLRLEDRDFSVQGLARHLVLTARSNGSADDATAVVVRVLSCEDDGE